VPWDPSMAFGRHPPQGSVVVLQHECR
jgi:hypothetical protein